MWRGVVLVFVCLLSACGGQQVTRADLERVIYQDGDWPVGWTAGPFGDTARGMSTDGAQLVVSREIVNPEAPVTGQVVVALWPSVDEASNAIPDDRATFTGAGEEGADNYNMLTYRRCRAVVEIISPSVEAAADELGAYARRLDERLQPLVC